jgi:predicted nucleic acid-binding protein
MTATIIDASVAIGLLTPSQLTPAIQTFSSTLASRALLAPAIFPIAMRNALVKLERRGLVGAHAADQDLPRLERLIDLAPALGQADRARILACARDLMLGFYDAIYVDLARQVSAEIATRDEAVLSAAQRSGVAVVDLS